jgi:L-cysteate sulfo-lyase
MPKRIHFGHFPTPLEESRTSVNELKGLKFYWKRDDLSGFALGGNKVRQVEFILADAIEKERDVLVVAGGMHSNFIRVLAAAAKSLGLDIIAAFYGSKPTVAEGNLLLCQQLGLEQHFSGSADRASSEDLAMQIFADLTQRGRKPHLVARGGASAHACVGSYLFFNELMEQCQSRNISFENLIVPTGSCTTLAGVSLAAAVSSSNVQIWGISVSRSKAEILSRISELQKHTSALISVDPVKAARIEVIDDYIGDGYGIPSESANLTIRMVAESTGIFLDPVFTGKAFHGFLDLVKKNKIKAHERHIFLHSGGHPNLFVSPKNLKLI